MTDFTVTADGSSIAVNEFFGERREVWGLTLTSPVYEGQTVLVSYTPGTNRIQDLSMNEAAAFTDEQVQNFLRSSAGHDASDADGQYAAAGVF